MRHGGQQRGAARVKDALRTSGTVIRRLGGAVPDAWHDDWIFRWAAIGVVLTGLATLGGKMLDAHLDGMRAENWLHPPPGLPLPPGVAPLPLPGSGSSQPAAAGPVSSAVSRIAPGQPLGGPTPPTTSATAGDRFGVAPAPR